MNNIFNQETAADEEKLPWDLVEEILSRVPPISLVRFRTVCKRWNALFDDKTFTNNHKSTFRFIIATESEFYSVSIEPKISVRELILDISGLDSQTPYIEYLADCNEFLLCCIDKVDVVWNPWLKQSRWIKEDVSQPTLQPDGIGFETNMRLGGKVYKTIGSYYKAADYSYTYWKIHDFTNDAWKDLDLEPSGSIQGEIDPTLLTRNAVSLNGTLYWVAYYYKTDPLFHLLYFVFSSQRFSRKFCNLPCGMNHPRDALVLMIFRGDRFSLLKQCHLTKKIEIWVTKNKINVEDGDNVVWMNFMLMPDFPDLVQKGVPYKPSYFIDNDKRLVVCSCDETGKACIYVVAKNMLISKVKIDCVVDPWPCIAPIFPVWPRFLELKKKKQNQRFKFITFVFFFGCWER